MVKRLQDVGADIEDDLPARKPPMKDIPASEFEFSRLHNGQLEMAMLLRLILDADLRPRLWPRLSADHFAADAPFSIYQRLLTYTRNGKEWPALASIAAEPALSPAARAQLASTIARGDRGLPLTHGTVPVGERDVPLETSNDFETHVFDLLEAYRITRKACESYVTITNAIADDEGFDPLTGPALVEQAAVEVLKLRSRETISDALLSFGDATSSDDEQKRERELERLHAADKLRFKTGFAGYDLKAGGFQPGEVVLIGSSTGGGKTAFMLTTMVNMARMGTSVAMLQLELTLQQITERLSANLANIDSELVRTGQLTPTHRKRIKAAWDQFHEELCAAKARLTVFAPSKATVQECEYVFKMYPYRVWFIDYISLVKHDEKLDGWEKLSATVKEFKELAKRYNICIVIACQVNVDKESGDIDVRYAKAMKEDADVVLVWHLTQDARDEGVVWVRHLKARQYEMFDFPLRVALQHCRFESSTPSDKPKLKVKSLRQPKKVKKEEAAPAADPAEVEVVMNTQAGPIPEDVPMFKRKREPLVVLDDPSLAGLDE